ncbi:MAG TPA: diaminopimelate epimerase, partial [Lachnospiraceae bacterium]|nr:diaminopimelate epimerase [Lachnospiraceae bacterium]
MEQLTMSKYHGVGNDYLVVDPNVCEIELTAEKIKKICDRNFGAGSDGILYGPVFKNDRIYVKIYNPDGSEAEKSGNGVRIFGKYLLDK